MDINDIKHLAVERIYLVPDASEGQLGYAWCDDPAPGLDMDPSEAVEYVRRDVHETRIAELEAQVEQHKAAEEMQIKLREKADERLDAALAHIARIIEARNSKRGDTLANICEVIDEATHQTSLARRDKIKQAEWISGYLKSLPWNTMSLSPIDLNIERNKLLKQAEQC